MTFFKNPKKCFCAYTRGVYISSLKGIDKKIATSSLWTDRQTEDRKTDRGQTHLTLGVKLNEDNSQIDPKS